MKMSFALITLGVLCPWGLTYAQQGPLSTVLQEPVQTYVASDDTQINKPVTPQAYENYQLSVKQVHPWPESEGLQPSVQTERRHIPPFISIGNDTRSLLRMQADSQRAGRVVPVSGVAASKAWERYLNSFTHPIPEFMEERISTSSTR